MRSLLKISIILLIITLISGCSQSSPPSQPSSQPSEVVSTFDIPVPTAPGENVEQNDVASIDYSNTELGYIIATYSGETDQTLRVVVNSPHDETYYYALSDGGVPEIIPLTEGDGEYTIGIYERKEADTFTKVISVKTNVAFQDEFITFVTPNQFVNYSKDSELVALAAELTKDAHTTEEKITAIYEFVVENFTYDYDRAANVQRGYLPNLDEVLKEKEGICFDYSALVTAMLRSQGIPTRLEIGYHGDQYHAWISKLCDVEGWIENRYHHNGDEWYRMDPTFESGEYKAHKSRHDARKDDAYRLMYNY